MQPGVQVQREDKAQWLDKWVLTAWKGLVFIAPYQIIRISGFLVIIYNCASFFLKLSTEPHNNYRLYLLNARTCAEHLMCVIQLSSCFIL